MSQASPLIQELSECRDKALAGGKAVNLGVLIRGGFPVPGGFVVTTEAYRGARANGSAKMSSSLADAICQTYRALGLGAVAVRSSATAEDMSEASMAGQYDTFLDINTEDALLESIHHCWASLDSPRTRSYLAEHGINLAQVAMAVVVQKLVPADVAGVLFSANPQTGSRREMLIEASWGLGESVVSGRVQPDVLRVESESGRVVAATISDKQVWLKPGNHDEQLVDEDKRRIPCLRSADVARLWQLGCRAAEHFGRPQDIEWAIHDGGLYLLQSRPITTLEHAEAYEQILQSTRSHLRESLAAGRGPWVIHNIGETLKHPTPLTWSVIKRFMSGAGGFGAMYKEVGFEPSAKVCAEGFLQRIAGKAYMDLSMASEMFFEAYPFTYDLNQVRANPDAAQSPPTIPAGPIGARLAVGRRVARVNLNVHRLAAELDRKLSGNIIPKFVAWCAEQKKLELAKLSTEELIGLWHEREKRVLDQFAPQSLLPSMITAMALAELRGFLAENFWDEDPDALAAMLSSGKTPDMTLLGNVQLYEVAQGRRSAEDWLGDYGHRGPDEFDLATPRWRERHSELLTMAQRLRDGVDPQSLHKEHLKKTQEKLEQLQRKLASRDVAELQDRLQLVHRYIGFREDGKYYLMLGYDLLRDVALEAGRRLDIGHDVFQLTLEELWDASRVGFAPHQLIVQRKRDYQAETKVSLPFLIDAPAIDTLGEPPKVVSAASRRAFPVSTGVAEGPARIVHSPEAAGDLGRGYVLVCPSTDPSWTPLFVNAAALILECGGTLSHGAVVAREMNIPAVVLAGATTLFADGEAITVDGRNGAVTRAGEAVQSVEADPNDTRIPPELTPPPPGRGERSAAKLRNISVLIWAVYLAAAFWLPEKWVYRPTFAVLDRVLWPLVPAVGKIWTVAIVAAAVAAGSMLCQRLLTDNTRLREAKRRMNRLMDEAVKFPRGSPRRGAMIDLASPVQMRIFMASLVPLAVLLGPMVMTFVWFPPRVDVAAWNADPGAAVNIVATVNSDLRTPVTLSATEPLSLSASTSATRTLRPIRERLEKLLEEWQPPSDLSAQPWEVREAARLTREEMLGDLKEYLKAGVPPQSLNWQVSSQKENPGRFPVTVNAGADSLTIDIVLGDAHPPGPSEVLGDGKGLLSLKVIYPPPTKKRTFWEPGAFIGKHWDAGWLSVYLIVYLPVMFGLKWALRVV
jgi:pyruvate,water dikinase